MNLFQGLESLARWNSYREDIAAEPAFGELVAFVDHELLEANSANMAGLLEGFKAAGFAREHTFRILDEWPRTFPPQLALVGVEDRIAFASMRLRFFCGRNFSETDWELVLAVVESRSTPT